MGFQVLRVLGGVLGLGVQGLEFFWGLGFRV